MSNDDDLVVARLRATAPFLGPLLGEAADVIDRLRARRPVVCGNCDGAGWYVDAHPAEQLPCPDCGKDGCGPGVVWQEDTP